MSDRTATRSEPANESSTATTATNNDIVEWEISAKRSPQRSSSQQDE